jgi:secreted Zn-dependent insulinase-like peptidase
MQVLFIQDLDCKKSAASVCVKAGHFNDPDSCYGLAHLLEHVIFNGSITFPEVDGFDRFLSQHAGGVNAWTGTEYSNYHFDVSHEYFVESLNRFKDMLYHPLLEHQAIVKEIQAIDAEFKLKINDDLRRLYQVHKETCNPAHPFSKFSVGNATTFSAHTTEQLQQLLQNFHKDNFVASNSRLVLISNQPIDDVKSHVLQLFTDLEYIKIKPQESLPPLYLPEQLGVLLSINPIKDARRLIVSFALPDAQSMYQTKPLEFISHLLGDEGKGSLLAYLKKQNWVTNLNAGGGINGSNFKDFNVNMQLTEVGQDKLPQILNTLFHFLSLINIGKDELWRLQEKAKLGQLAFDYAETSKTIDEAQHLANQMFHYPQEHLLSGDYLISQFDISTVAHCLHYMRPQNMRLKYICKDVPTNKQAKWYSTPYAIESLQPQFISDLSSPQKVNELRLPEKNLYISAQLLLPKDSTHPILPQRMIESDSMHAWFAQDDQFQQPKGDCFVSFDSVALSKGVNVSAHKRLWIALMSEHLNDQFYQAGVAGLHYHIYPHQVGFTLHTSGFSHKQLDLSSAIIKQTLSQIDLSHMFEQVKSKQVQGLQNSLLNKPINRLFTRLSEIVQRQTHAPQDILKSIQNATIEDVYQVRNSVINQNFVEVLTYGNWYLEQAKNHALTIDKMNIRSSKGIKIKREVIDLKHSQRYLNSVDSQHKDAAVVMYFQTPSATNRDTALTILVEQLLASPFFHTIRNEKQLGYLVGSGYLPLNQHPGMAFYIQSPTHNAKQLISEIDDFLAETVAKFVDLKEIWQYVRSSVKKQLIDSDTGLSMKSQRYWLAIGTEEQDFNHQNALAEELEKLTFDDVFLFAKQMIQTDLFGALILYCTGEHKDDLSIKGEEIQSVDLFKTAANYIL